MSKDYVSSGMTVLDCLAPWGPASAVYYMRLAQLCNKLAKLVKGHLRQRLYRFKDQNLRLALRLNSTALDICVDRDLHVGLLSVRLHVDPRIRVHTHENWLKTA